MFEALAERRIAEALAKGELDNLPGAGRPLDLDDDRLVPEDLRMAYRILKNAGLVPAELGAAVRKLELLKARLEPRYYKKALRAFSSRTRRSPS